MLTIVLGTAVLILILFVILIGYCLVDEVADHEDLKKRHEVLREQSHIWVRRAVIAERKVEAEASENVSAPMVSGSVGGAVSA